MVPHMRRIYRAEGASVKVIDDYTVEVNTGDAVAFDFTWRNRLNGANCPVPSGSKKYFEEVGEERATMEGIGTGPWQFVEFRTNERFISEAVEDHWRKTPFFKELHYFQIPEESTRVANFLAGELDTMQMALGSIPALLDAPGVKFQRYPDALELHMNLHGQRYIDREGIPARNPDFPWISASADPNSPEWEQARKVREALSISINRQLIVDSVLEGEGRADNPYWRWGGLDRFFDEEMRNTQVVYDVDRARQLLEEAGYGDGFTIPIALTQRSYPGTPAVGEAVCLMWEQINVTCEQQRMAMTAFRPTFVARTGEGFNTHDNSPAEEPIAAYSNIISSKGLINFGAEHPWLDEMVAKAEKTGDFEKRMEIQREIAKFIQM